MADDIPTPDDLERQALSASDEVARELLAALSAVRSGLVLSSLTQWLLRRNVEAAIRSIGIQRFTDALTKAATSVWPTIRADGFQGALHELPADIINQPSVGATLADYLRTNPVLATAIGRQDLARIQGITLETQDAVRLVITDGYAANTPPPDLARVIQQMVGITKAQTGALAKYRATLLRQNREQDQIDRMVAREATRKLKFRSGTIAHSETMRVQNEGRRIQWSKLVNDGVLQSDEWEREWIGSHLESECPFCLNFDGMRAVIGGVFTGRDGDTSSGPTLHPRCACIERLVPVGFRRGEPIAPARDAILKKLGRLNVPLAA